MRVKLFIATNPANLECDINMWLIKVEQGTARERGVKSVGKIHYATSATATDEDGESREYTALVEYEYDYERI